MSARQYRDISGKVEVPQHAETLELDGLALQVGADQGRMPAKWSPQSEVLTGTGPHRGL